MHTSAAPPRAVVWGTLPEPVNRKKGRKIFMKNNAKRFASIVGIGLALIMPLNKTFADSESKAFANSDFLKQLSGEWWQWALSIPTSVNPLADATGDNAFVGQRG